MKRAIDGRHAETGQSAENTTAGNSDCRCGEFRANYKNAAFAPSHAPYKMVAPMGTGAMSRYLYGYRYSVYSWIAKLALYEKGVDHEWVEIDPFTPEGPADYLRLHPFRRVPVLSHDGFSVYETCAITRYVDEGFRGPDLQPADPRRRARCSQIISIVDSYAYWPLVRQAYSHRVFRKLLGRAYDDAEAEKGLIAAPNVLGALETIAEGTTYLCGSELSLADIHLAPMIGYFTTVPEGVAILRVCTKLSTWWSAMSSRVAYRETEPKPPPFA